MKKLKSVAVIAACAVGATPLQAACWNDATYQAAQVRELETMLAVGAMRCRSENANFARDYNGFVQSNAAALEGASNALRRHFATQFGDTGSEAYDVFLAAETDRQMTRKFQLGCEDLAAIAKTASYADSPTALARFAQSADLRPAAADKLCRDGLPALQVAAVGR